MGAWVLTTSENPGGTLLEKTEECDRYVNLPQDRMQEWCCIVDPHFLLLPFHTQIIMGCIVLIGTYSHLFEASLREKSKKVLDLLGLGSQDDGEMPQGTLGRIPPPPASASSTPDLFSGLNVDTSEMLYSHAAAKSSDLGREDGNNLFSGLTVSNGASAASAQQHGSMDSLADLMGGLSTEIPNSTSDPFQSLSASGMNTQQSMRVPATGLASTKAGNFSLSFSAPMHSITVNLPALLSGFKISHSFTGLLEASCHSPAANIPPET
ncbi:unnamed protein product [Sphagnum troendelagicum]|uniref:Uncharacterized protein n=1 Tax=Sphagnum troendelagicum TaxID=128251 RepID=A0ABP0TJW3_9BRYO